MDPHHTPSFFKILIDPAAPHLPLPPDFVAKHLVNKIPTDPIIRSANGEYSWRLKITKIGESYCFSDGWNNVVRDTELRFGDFLIFRLVDQYTFKVLIYSPNGCEKDLPSKNKVEQDGGIVGVAVVDDDDDNVNDDVGVAVVDDDDDEEEQEKDNDDNEEEDADDDDEEEEEDDEEQIEYVDDDDDDDEEDEDDGGGDIDGDDGDPFFTSIISRTHKLMLRLPLEFARLAGIDGEGPITLKNLDGEEWETSLRLDKSGHRYYVSTRWQDFRQSNDLSEGDECVFKFIRNEGTLLLAKVTRKKRRASDPQPFDGTSAIEGAKRKKGQPQPRTHGGVPANEDAKKKKGSLQTHLQPRPVRGVATTKVAKRKKAPPEVVKRTRGRPGDRRLRTRKAS